MNQEELLKVYLEKLGAMALERLQEKNISALDAIKESLNFIEGEMKGY